MNFQGSASVLLLDSVANIDELSVLEQKEIMALGEFSQSFDGSRTKVGEDVDVCLEDCDMWSEAYTTSKNC